MNASDVIDSRYRLERLLGTGGMSEVWLAEDMRLGRWVGVKLLRGAGPDSDLEREARVVARLQHPNIAAVYDTGRHEGEPYLVMEYVHGLSLRDLLAERGGRMAEAEAVRYGVQVADALKYAHDRNVIHCDIKPENILITEQGVAKAVDFGIAETLSRTLSTTAAREILGTIPYLAPEVIGGSSPSPASDTYSLALTMYELIAGRLPFAGANAAAATGQRLANPAPRLRTFAASASPEIETVLARALSITPSDRYASAAEFGAALTASQERRARTTATPAAAPLPVIVRRQAPAPVRAAPVRYETARLSRRRGVGAGPFWAVLIGGLLLIGGGIALAVALSKNGGDNSPSTATPTAVTLTATASATTPPKSATAAATPSPTATASRTPTATPEPPTATATRTSPAATATRTNPPASPTTPPANTATATRTP